MNKPQLSVITTSPVEQPSKTGTQDGGLGLATLVGLDRAPQHVTPDQARHMINCLGPFSGRRPETNEELEVAREASFALSNPAPRTWIASRVVSLLSHYFVAQQEAKVAEAVAEDWCAMLSDYPAWALAETARWWLSHENPRKHFKPLPGDIQERAHALMEPVRVARFLVARGVAEKPVQKPRAAEAASNWGSEEEKAKRRAFAESLGLRKFGGEA